MPDSRTSQPAPPPGPDPVVEAATVVTAAHGEGAAALAALFLDEEDKRLTEDAARHAREEMADERIPGFGKAAMPLRQAFKIGGYGTMGTVLGLTIVADFDTAAMQVLAPDIQRTFNIGDSLLGAIASLTGLLLLLGSLPVGYFGDRLKRTRIIGAVAAIFSMFLIASGAVQAAWQMAIARLGAGAGRSSQPVKFSLLVDQYPIEARGRILSLFLAGGSIGNVCGPLFAGLVATVVFKGYDDSWRFVFLVLAVPACLLSLKAFRLKEPVRGSNELELLLGSDQEGGLVYEPPPLANAFARLRKIRTFFFFLLGISVIGFALFGWGTFFSLFLESHWGLAATDRGIILSIGAIGGILSAPLAGRIADRLYRQNPRKVVIVGALLMNGFLLNLVALWMPSLYLLLPFLILGSGSIVACFACFQPVLAAVMPPRMRAQGNAMIGIYLFFMGAFMGAIITGALADKWGERAALTAVIPLPIIAGSILMMYGSRFVKDDIQLMVEELDEEREESQRIRDGGEVPTLQVRNLDFSYGPLQVLFDINFNVSKGETVALLGTNGAGKSTLLRAISGLGVPDRGAVRLNARTLTYSDAESRFQQGIVQVRGADVFPGLSVEDNLKAALIANPKTRKETDRLLQKVYNVFPVLQARRHQDAASLSGGEQQMVAFGTCLMHEPEVLLIDELSLGLAPLVVQELLQVVDRMKAAGMTMVIVEQSLNVATAIADRAIFIEKGRVRFDGPTSDLATRGDLARAVFLGGEGG